MTNEPNHAAQTLIPQTRMGGPGLRAFYNIAKEWGLSDKEQMILLGDVASSTFYHWKKQALPGGDLSLGRDTLERLSYILGIYKALRILLPESHAGWVRRPNSNPLFGGRPALDRMLSGNVADLYIVRQFLDAWRGGWA
jgi:hypothetical protein